METVYDWISLLVFSGLVVLFLQRSTADEQVDTIWHYAPPSIGCAVCNWLGNNGHDVFAVAVLVASLAYIFLVLKPVLPTR